MTRYDIMRDGFRDELKKIAGELQGFTRIGRRPIGVDRLLEKETEAETTPSQVVEETVKLSSFGPSAKSLALLGAGAGVYHLIRQANEDRRMGRLMRRQQG